MKFTKEDKTHQFDPEKCTTIYEQLVEVFKNQEQPPTIGEIIIAYGNLGYALGASIEGFKGKGPSVEEVEKEYYANPGKIGFALMLAGLTTCTWYDSYMEQAQQNNEARNKDKSEE